MKLKHAAWLAGIIDGEGTICLKYIKDPRCPRYAITISIVNTDPLILDRCIQLLKPCVSTFHVRVYKETRLTRNTCYKIEISRQEDVLKVLGIIRRHLVGYKRRVANRCYSLLALLKQKQGKLGIKGNKDMVLEKRGYYEKLARDLKKIKTLYSCNDFTFPSSDEEKIKSELISNNESSQK